MTSFGFASQQPTGSSGFSFGTAPATPASSSVGFGTFTTTTPNNPPPSNFGTGFGTSFGAAASQPTISTGASTFSFGGPATSTSAPTSTFGGFGATPSSSAPAFGGFGTTPASSAPAFGGFATTSSAPTFGGFGGTATSSTPTFGLGTTPASSAPTFGFSSAPASYAPTFGFGTTPATSASLFGPSTVTPTPSSTGIFGSNTFGNTTASNTPMFSFGTTNSTPATNSLFGGTSSFGTFSGLQNQQQTQQQQQFHGYQSVSAQTPWQQYENIRQMYDPQSPRCQFRHYFYNMVHPSEVQNYTKPPQEDEASWMRAQQDNPDPSCMVPVLAVGYGDVKKRIIQQEQQSNVHLGKLMELAEKIKEMQQRHNLETTVKSVEYKKRHMELAHRTLQLMRSVQVLRNLGLSIRPEEEALRVRFENLQLEMHKSGQYQSKLLELWAQVQIIAEQRRFSAENGITSKGWEVGDTEQMGALLKVLDEHQAGLIYVQDLLKRDLVDVGIIQKELDEREKSRT